MASVGVTLTCTVAPLASPPTSALERFLQRDDPVATSYRAERRLEARNIRFNVGWMHVVTELAHDGSFTWTTIAEGGSGHIRSRVLRKALDAEAAAIRAGQPGRAAVTLDNYSFSANGIQNDQVATVGIEPRRHDVLLIVGSILLKPSDGDLLQIQGRLSKNPSFWTRSVDVIRRYERRNGVRVPVALESTSDVRLVGRSEFVMTYSYSSVNGQPVAGQ